MSKQWEEVDAEIGRLIAEKGVEHYAEFDPIKKCVLYLGAIETANMMQMHHKNWLDKIGAWYNEVIEIGGGVGIFAHILSEHVPIVRIIDNPNMTKIQEYSVPHIPHTDMNCEIIPQDTLIVSLFALSELDVPERMKYWEKFKDCQWFIGFQEVHTTMTGDGERRYENMQWFLQMAVNSRRKFIMEPMGKNRFQTNWYLYIEARK